MRPKKQKTTGASDLFRAGLDNLRGNIARTALPKTNHRNCPRFSGLPVP
jgi:hypothetical protein